MNNSDRKNPSELSASDERRREFLRKSAYAAYAAPVIMALLVEKASAAQSWNPGKGHQHHNNAPPQPPVGWLGKD